MLSTETRFIGVLEVVIDETERDCPDTGLVLKWRRRGDRWEGLVTHMVDGKPTTEWLPALVLSAAAAS